MRNNQKGYRLQPFKLRKCRKRIETLFAQLCDQFIVRRNYAKTFEKGRDKGTLKMTGLIMVQFLTKFIFNRNINSIKISIV
uniref:hypothetical protein n=1 Tax=Sinomicrobium oceani TaxID=1150368 RepID=UPI00227B343E|nr:hypothetical protein [Sinomicrobium oceani]